MSPIVLLTDYAWPDDSIEREIIEAAGMRLVAGPAAPSPAAAIEALVREHQPSAIMTCWAPVSAEAIASSPSLKIVARLGVGLDNIDVDGGAALRQIDRFVEEFGRPLDVCRIERRRRDGVLLQKQPKIGEPPKRLVGFQKLVLNPGEQRQVTITVDPNASNHPVST